MSKLHSYIQELVSNGFPELVNTRLVPNFSSMDDAFFEFERKSKFEYEISVDKHLKKVSKPIIVGGLAHELAHILKEVRLTPILSSFELLLYNFVPFYSTLDERQTDKLVIERGFGEELLAFVKYANKRREDYTIFDGLTQQEIELAVHLHKRKRE